MNEWNNHRSIYVHMNLWSSLFDNTPSIDITTGYRTFPRGAREDLSRSCSWVSNFNPQTVLFLRGPSFSDPWRIQRYTYWIPLEMEILDLGSCVASRVLIFSRMAERKCKSLGRLPLWLPMTTFGLLTLDDFPGENKLPAISMNGFQMERWGVDTSSHA